MRVSEFNALPDSEAGELLRGCCGSLRWVAEMMAGRPFPSRAAIVAQASSVWQSLAPEDWLEAFRHHPRIGERQGELSQTSQGSEWSGTEQGGVAAASSEARHRLVQANRDYELRFGFVFLINATGQSAEMMLEAARQRMSNDVPSEFRIAAEQQRQIMILRLEKLFAPDLPERQDEHHQHARP